MRTSEKFLLVLVLFSFAVSIFIYPELPDQMPSHWNAAGEVDRYMSRAWGAAILPLSMSILYILFYFIPRVDPLKSNLEKFRRHFDRFIYALALFFIFIYAQSILWSLDIQINPVHTLPAALGILFYIIGIMLKHARRNWFLGVRTPWTMSSETVWLETHRRTAIAFQAAGIVSFLGIFTVKYALYISLTAILSAALYGYLYSYLLYRKLHPDQPHK